MTVRESRKAAEQAARDLIQERVKLVGDLAVAASGRAAAATSIAEARRLGQEEIHEAEARADALLKHAQNVANDAENAYAQQYVQTMAGGWSPTELKQLGFGASRDQRRLRGQRLDKPGEATAEPTVVSQGGPAISTELIDVNTDLV